MGKWWRQAYQSLYSTETLPVFEKQTPISFLNLAATWHFRRSEGICKQNKVCYFLYMCFSTYIASCNVTGAARTAQGMASAGPASGEAGATCGRPMPWQLASHMLALWSPSCRRKWTAGKRGIAWGRLNKACLSPLSFQARIVAQAQCFIQFTLSGLELWKPLTHRSTAKAWTWGTEPVCIPWKR